MKSGAIQDVTCSECGAGIRRRPVNPNTGNMIVNFFCGVPCKAKHQERARPISKDDLRAMYEGGMSANEIAAKVGRNSKRVWEWLQADGVATRPRGHDERVRFKKGHTICVGRVVKPETREKIRKAQIANGAPGLFRPDGSHVLKGRRGSDHPSWQGGGTPERQAFYASDEWKAACRIVWHRADAKCERCGLDHRSIDRSALKFHVHHIAGFTAFPERRADPCNLKLLCAPCHRWVHGRENINKEMIEVKNAA